MSGMGTFVVLVTAAVCVAAAFTAGLVFASRNSTRTKAPAWKRHVLFGLLIVALVLSINTTHELWNWEFVPVLMIPAACAAAFAAARIVWAGRADAQPVWPFVLMTVLALGFELMVYHLEIQYALERPSTDDAPDEEWDGAYGDDIDRDE